MVRRKDGLTLRDVGERLTLTEKDIARLRRSHMDEYLVQTGTIEMTFYNGLAFKCACCSDINGHDVFYDMIKRRIGVFEKRINPADIKTTRGVVRQRDLREKPEYASVPCFTRDGLVCEHCYESVYTNGPKFNWLKVSVLS